MAAGNRLVFAVLLPLLAAAATYTPEPPTTVNGQVLGDAEDFATVGPARVCLKDMVVSPNKGEVVYLEYLGIHDARLRLVLVDGTYLSLTQGDAFQDQRRQQQGPAIKRPGRSYYLIAGQALPRYQMVTVDGASGESSQMLFLSGTALSGRQSDEAIFDRLSFGADQVKQCDRRFGYGWDGVFWTRPSKAE